MGSEQKLLSMNTNELAVRITYRIDALAASRLDSTPRRGSGRGLVPVLKLFEVLLDFGIPESLFVLLPHFLKAIGGKRASIGTLGAFGMYRFS